jgi:hypothetical protein
MPEVDGLRWQQGHIELCTHPSLGEGLSPPLRAVVAHYRLIGIDVPVKPLYGRQEGGVVSYNPKKPGRPSHVHHTYMLVACD